MFEFLRSIDIYGATANFQTEFESSFRTRMGGAVVIGIVLSYLSINKFLF